MISAVAVVVPARDEEDAIAHCTHGLRRALEVVPEAIRSAACVVVDRSRDGTREVLQQEAPFVRQFVNTHELPLGAVRDAGVQAMLAELGSPPAHTWVLHTDADSVVPPDWILTHLQYASTGAHAVAGLTTIGNWSSHKEHTRQPYDNLVNERIHNGWHKHVYGANLGVRADAYHHVGGFRPLHSGEDHDLWHRLHAADFRLMQPCESPVLTSARTVGRASGGLADLLRTLGNEDSTPRPDKAA